MNERLEMAGGKGGGCCEECSIEITLPNSFLLITGSSAPSMASLHPFFRTGAVAGGRADYGALQLR